MPARSEGGTQGYRPGSRNLWTGIGWCAARGRVGSKIAGVLIGQAADWRQSSGRTYLCQRRRS